MAAMQGCLLYTSPEGQSSSACASPLSPVCLKTEAVSPHAAHRAPAGLRSLHAQRQPPCVAKTAANSGHLQRHAPGRTIRLGERCPSLFACGHQNRHGAARRAAHVRKGFLTARQPCREPCPASALPDSIKNIAIQSFTDYTLLLETREASWKTALLRSSSGFPAAHPRDGAA